jgi:ATP sulfurylase
MSHSTLQDLKYYIDLSKKVEIPFIIDTEGSQVRTGDLSSDNIIYKENDNIRLYKKSIVGNKKQISLKPWQIINQLQEGDILYVDFDTLVMRVSNISTIKEGFIEATIISSGNLGKNKGVVIDPQVETKYSIPNLTKKDIKAIQLGLEENIGYVAASFMRNIEAVREVKKISNYKMKIISKIECKDALENLNDIISESDYLLIDRGDLSKEIPIEKIPFTQKIILNRANNANKKVFVATNLLESMISNRKPTRAEVNDILNTIVDGAYGLTLAAETAIGNHPIGCINMLNKIIRHSNLVINANEIRNKEKEFVQDLEKNNYLLDEGISSSMIMPHGGKLVNRFSEKKIDRNYLNSLKKIQLNTNQQSDIEQIAIGTYSPLEGFLVRSELESVLDKMRLPNGVIWPLPILLDVDIDKGENIDEGDTVALIDEKNDFVGTIEVKEKYFYDKKILAEKLYGSIDTKHPGNKIINSLKPVFLGGKISLFKMFKNEYDKYHLTPKQARRLFEEKNWVKVAGFHTRNVIHRAHEFIQLSSLEKGKCDGLFIHPVIGKKKTGDYDASFIIKSYEIMQKEYYPDNKVVFGVFSTYSRYAGEREAIFTALCRKNYGCSAFIIGRDHTGVGSPKNNSRNIFSKFPDLGIEIIGYNSVYYSKKTQSHFEESDDSVELDDEKISISGSEARKMFKNNKLPPSWYMRPKISKMIMKSIKAKESVFL